MTAFTNYLLDPARVPEPADGHFLLSAYCQPH
jgi:hypothetical protein